VQRHLVHQDSNRTRLLLPQNTLHLYPASGHMVDALLTAAAFVVTYLSFALLSLTQERHWSSVLPRLPQSSNAVTRRHRWIAVIGLAIGCGLCLLGNGQSFGLLLWAVLLSACAMATALTLAWKPEWLRVVARMAGI
jgi:hypothetical protein